MKLLLCRVCGDVFNLRAHWKACSCGHSGGKYEQDGLHAVFYGEMAIPLGIHNKSLKVAIIDSLRDAASKRVKQVHKIFANIMPGNPGRTRRIEAAMVPWDSKHMRLISRTQGEYEQGERQ